MTIYGIGCDIVHIPRISGIFNRWGARFVARILHPEEIHHFNSTTQTATFLASRWAVKEAVFKSLKGARIPLTNMVIQRGTQHGGRGAAPEVHFKGEDANNILKQLGIAKIHITISHEKHYAVANAVAETIPTYVK